MNKIPKIQPCLPAGRLGQKPTYKKFAQDVDFYSLFEKFEESFNTCFIFESLGVEGRLSRYSVIGFDPKHIIRARENTFFIDDNAYEVENPYFEMRDIMPKQSISRNYAGGLVGYLNYDAVNYFEPAVRVKLHKDFDQFMFGVYTDGLILDKVTNELFYFFYDKDRSDTIRVMLNSVQHLSRSRNKFGMTMDDKLKVRFLGDSLTKKEHAKIVAKVKEEIKKGNIFQCEVGFKSEFTITGNALEVYKQLRQVNPSPFMYFVKFGDKKIIGASPELLFGLRNGEMTTAPLAGTIRRGRSEVEDQQLARQLLSDPKEQAEHNMLVDLQRNDVGRVAEFGTVKVRDFMSVKRFSHVQHISSEIVGIIKRDEDMFSALASNFPTGTLTGAPKIEAMKIIDRNEKEARGPYGGGVGHFGFNGDCTFAIAIRSLFISGNYAYTQTSGGVVYDSAPEKEYDEIQRKLAAMKEVLQV